MNTSKIKTYAIQARRDFLKAVTEQANFYGIYGDHHIEEMTIKGDVAIIADRPVTRKQGELRQRLVDRIKRDGFEMTLRAAAYTWFNRLAALRYMELHGYLEHGFRVLSHPAGSGLPEILEHVADVDLPGLEKNQAIELRLAGNKDNELYRLLIMAQCNVLQRAMPFLFDKIDSETELLLPGNLLHSDSLIRKLVADIPEDDWREVEIIGWLYQFYISEKKDDVIGKVVKSEDIPAATQLFTPNWIVKYMVQNTLGRLWLSVYPHSPLRSKMEYYVEPAEQDPEVQKKLDAATPRELNPEAITFFDPAQGSGHILAEAYDIFKEIYLERGYRTRDIPRLILEHNLFGLDICDRAAQLAGFALLMKARADDRHILGYTDLKLNIHAIQKSRPSDLHTIEKFFASRDHEALRDDLKTLGELFENAKTFGSLIAIPELLVGRMPDIARIVEDKIGKWVAGSEVHNLRALTAQAAILARKFDCVVTNPPYMGNKGMNPQLKEFAKNRFPDTKSDLFAIFVERIINMARKDRPIGIMTPFTWMFLSSYEKLREKIISQNTLLSLIRPEYHAFFESAYVPICTFIIFTMKLPEFKGTFIDLTKFYGTELQAPKVIEAIQNPDCGWFFLASAADFKKIPGSPIAYWVSEKVRSLFIYSDSFESNFDIKAGISTGKNESFILFWSEVSFNLIRKNSASYFVYVPHNKGGEFRKWMGNWDSILKYSPAHLQKMMENDGFRHDGKDFYFQPHIGWSKITSSNSSFRYYPKGFSFDSAGLALFAKDKTKLQGAMGFLNSRISMDLIKILNPTLNVTPQIIKKLPFVLADQKHTKIHSILYKQSKSDWDSYETSWDFSLIPLLYPDHHHPALGATYEVVREHCRSVTLEMQRLEEENNRIFIEAYGLQDELTPEVPLSEITLTCNPYYRYGGNRPDEELETLLLTDTVKELISYAVGCMMGRYRLDRPGLIYAHAGNKDFDEIYHRKDAEDAKKEEHNLREAEKNPLRDLRFCGGYKPDDDGIVPIMDMGWFPDDAASRFVEFIKTAWPAEHLKENLQFVADALSPKRGEDPADTIRRYLSTGFFKDHLKTYKKRPIYWLFSSGRQKAFECLVYLHRYNESTLSRMRSQYVTPLQGNIRSRIAFLQHEKDAAASASDQRKFQKELDTLKKKQAELARFDDELRHYADMRTSLDLDDGVKVNYGKFGNLLAEVKAITGE